MKKLVSIRDVAKEAGVAISTVSKVLNHYPNVSGETKKKVNAAITKLGFVPNTIASALSSKKTGRAALVLDADRHAQTMDEIPVQYMVGAMKALIDMDIYRPVCGFDGVSLMEGGSGRDIVMPHKLIRIKYLDVIP